MDTRTNLVKRIKKLPVFQDEKDLLTFLERSLTDNLKQFIKVSITSLIKAEMEQIGEDLQSQSYFNGSYNR